MNRLIAFVVVCASAAGLQAGCAVSRGPSAAQMRAQQEYIDQRMREASEQMETQMADLERNFEASQAAQSREAPLTDEERAQRNELMRTEMAKVRAMREQEAAQEREMRKDPRVAKAMDEADEEYREMMRKNPSGVSGQFDLADREEAALGLEMVPSLLGNQKLSDDAVLQQYVSRVGTWVAQQSERPGLPWRFAVIDSDSVNAFAIPGGYVFITRGMLQMLESESELAGVLGHEISHVVRKHHLRWVTQNKQLQASMQVTRAQIRKYNPSMQATMDRLDQAMQKQFAFLQSGPMRAGLGRSEEMQADTDGATLAWRAGYDAYGLASALQRFEAHQRPRYDVLRAELTDHPEPVQRLKMLDLALSSRAEKDTAGEAGLERYAAATRSVRGTTH